MDVEEYLAAIDRFADDMNKTDAGFEHYMAGLKATSPFAESCVTFRLSISTASDLAHLIHANQQRYVYN